MKKIIALAVLMTSFNAFSYWWQSPNIQPNCLQLAFANGQPTCVSNLSGIIDGSLRPPNTNYRAQFYKPITSTQIPLHLYSPIVNNSEVNSYAPRNQIDDSRSISKPIGSFKGYRAPAVISEEVIQK